MVEPAMSVQSTSVQPMSGRVTPMSVMSEIREFSGSDNNEGFLKANENDNDNEDNDNVNDNDSDNNDENENNENDKQLN